MGIPFLTMPEVPGKYLGLWLNVCCCCVFFIMPR